MLAQRIEGRDLERSQGCQCGSLVETFEGLNGWDPGSPTWRIIP